MFLNHDKNPPKQPVLVAQTNNQATTGMITALLDQNGIPYYQQPNDLMNAMVAYLGYSPMGDEIFVSSEDFERAKALVDEVTARD